MDISANARERPVRYRRDLARYGQERNPEDFGQGCRSGHTFFPEKGLELADALVDEPALRAYHLLPSVRGDLLARLGRPEEARARFERAAELTRNAPERRVLLNRAASLGSPAP